MRELRIGDVVRTTVNVGSSSIPIGSVGTINKIYPDTRNGESGFWYSLAEFPPIGFKQSGLELVTTSFHEIATNTDTISSVNPDLEKRVSKTRDKLLRDIFE